MPLDENKIPILESKDNSLNEHISSRSANSIKISTPGVGLEEVFGKINVVDTTFILDSGFFNSNRRYIWQMVQFLW